MSEIEFRREPIGSLRTLEDEWHSLEGAASASFFTSWHWIGTLLEALPAANRPQLLRASTPSGTAALALCGHTVRHRVKGLVRSRALSINETGDPHFDSIFIEHNSFLAVAELETAVMTAALHWLTELRGEADELRFSGVLRCFSKDQLVKYGLDSCEVMVPSYSVDLRKLEKSEGQLYPVLSANARQQLRRSIRDYERHGPVSIRRAATTSEALTFFDEFRLLHIQSWARRGKRHAFTSEFFEHFHKSLITRTFPDRAIHILRITAGDHLVGILYNFRYGNRMYAYQSGFADLDRRSRPGMVAHALAIQHAFETGAKVYDFMAGRNRLKERFSTCSEPMIWQRIYQQTIPFRVEKMARRLYAKVAGVVWAQKAQS